MRILLRALPSLRVVISAVLILVGLQLESARAQGTAGATNAASATNAARTPAQLEQILAPIALYPDALLSQIFMASTYPLEIVEAARWVQANPGLTGKALEDALQKQTWDPSVKSLTAVPETLRMMSDKLDWTRQLGDAFLAQQSDVLDAVQQLRARADNAGSLKSGKELTVTKTAAPSAERAASGGGGSAAPATTYVIENANPEQYYVPLYDPNVAYGTWPYSDYAPYYWPGYYGYGGYYGGGLLAFGAGMLVGSAIWGNIDWGRHNVTINPLRYNQFNRTNIAGGNWAHNPAHRGGVPYRDGNVANRFGDANRAASRENFRGQADAGRGDLAKQGAGNRQSAAKGQGAGNRQGTGAANKPGAGNKAAQKGGAKTKTAAKGGAKTKTAAKGGGSKQARSNQGAKSKQASHGGGGGNQARSGGARPSAARPSPAARSHAQTGGGGGARMGGGGGGRGGGGGGGGRRSDVRLKHDIFLLGRLDNGLGFYRFSYNGGDKAYVGVMAQEVQRVMPQAVVHGSDGYLRVRYDELGLRLQTHDDWLAAGGQIPSVHRIAR